MSDLIPSDRIAGVTLVPFRAFGDERGRFMETFRLSWFPQRSWARLQSNRSDSQAGVLRGLHYHFHQVDYWCLMRGHLRVGLADLRQGSPTFGAGQIIDITDEQPMGIYIPVGVAHGFYAVTDVTLTYMVDNYYDGSDEYGVAWNDPAFALEWGADQPILSARDAANPRLAEIEEAKLPIYEAA
ncbi:MAG: dTDP-4-dehydrorhamnose 3,5-epimerase family protein [Caldilineaceae bacterium]|nr:dTDP-4-dehydrorhamnose 3,5-epimerase family protein [Caldilineaceae bacterium]